MAKKKAAKKVAKKVKAKKDPPRLKAPIITTVPRVATVDEIIAQIKKSSEEREAANKEMLRELCDELFLIGVKSVEVGYNGEGDSGNTTYVTYDKINDDKVPQELENRLKDLVWALLPSGFENNDGGFGQATLNVAEKRIKIEHNTRYIEISYDEINVEL